VLVLDNLTKGHRDAVGDECRFAQIDLNETAAVASELRAFGCEAVIHMAADSLVGESPAAVAQREIPVRRAPRREGDPAVLVASSERIRQDLGWRPRRQRLEDIIESAWRWMCRHELSADAG
jgi:UDP-glucose 4-epimerase